MKLSCSLLVYHFVVVCLLVASMTWAAIFTMDPSKTILMESNNIDLIRNQWSASFSNFHQMKIVNKELSHVSLDIICETNTHVENVYLKFQASDNVAEKRMDLNQPISQNSEFWSMNLNQKAIVNDYQSYQQNQGGRIKLLLKDQPWTGKLWCEIHEKEKSNFHIKIIKSNEIQIVDIRSIISDVLNSNVVVNIPNYESPANIGVTLKPYPEAQRGFFSSGLLAVSPAWYAADLIEMNNYFDDIPETKKIIFGSPRLMKTSTEQMLPDKIGAYFIDKYGQIHVNWNQEIIDEMKKIFEKRQKPNYRGLVNYFTLGSANYMYTLEPHSKVNLKQNPALSFDLPKRVYPPPEQKSTEIIVTRNQSAEYLECGFLSNDPNLRIKWSRVDGQMKSLEDLGFVLMPSETSIRLTNGKIDSSGTYKCELLSHNVPVPNMEASFKVEIFQLPYFGEVTYESPAAGKPPPLIILMDGDSVEVKCTADGYNGNENKDLKFTMTPLLDRSLSDAIQLNWTSYLYNMPVSSNWSPFARTIVYRVYNLKATLPAIKQSQSHLVECAMRGYFKYMDYNDEIVKDREQKSEVYSHIIVSEKFTNDNMEQVPVPCDMRKNKCQISQSNVFSCVMKQSMKEKLSKNHITWTIQWKIGDYSQKIIENEGSDSLLKKYIKFTEHNVTILPVISESDQNKLNNLIKRIQCIFKLSYPAVTNKQWLKDKVVITSSMGTTLPPLDSTSFEFYSTEYDASMTHLIANNVYLIGIPTVTTASLWIIAPICLAVIFIICIFVIVGVLIARNKGESYAIDLREREQGRDPVKELKENHFNEYVRPERNFPIIHGSRASLNSSIRVGSDNEEDDEMEEYGSFNNGKFDEDGSFIGNYTSDGKKERKPDSRV